MAVQWAKDGTVTEWNTTFAAVALDLGMSAEVAGSADVAYLHGGMAGDELAFRLLSELPPAIAPGGRALLMLRDPARQGTTLAARAREALADQGLNLVAFHSDPPPIH